MTLMLMIRYLRGCVSGEFIWGIGKQGYKCKSTLGTRGIR